MVLRYQDSASYLWDHSRLSGIGAFILNSDGYPQGAVLSYQ